MHEASQMLTKEYTKRVCLDSIDRQNFLDFVKPYRNGNVVDFERMKQAGVLDEYNLRAYLTIASSLGKQVLESFIKEQSGYGKDPQMSSKIEAQINRLKGLQTKTVVGQESGGFIDTLEIEFEGGRETKKSSLEIGDHRLDVSGRTVEEQVELYRLGINQMLLNEMRNTGVIESGQAITAVCSTVMKKEPIIKEVVDERAKENVRGKQATSYQKSLTQN